VKICITGGGTGGHLMIAEALLEAATKAQYDCIFIGSTKGQDRKYFKNSTLFSKVYFLETTGVVNQKGLGKLKALFKVLVAFFKARKLLKENKIDVVYSVGGFSAAPASIASLSKKIPLFIHEQNAVEGRLNAILKPYAKSFISAYDDSSPIKGYPVKDVFSQTQRERTSLNTIIFLGGSNGAKAINDLALSVASLLFKQQVKIIHQAGESDFERVKKEYEILGIEVELYAFTTQLPKLIEKSDLAVSRAGASTLWELTTNGCPAFYIPYPYAAGDHQFFNARFIVQNEMGWCERESENLRAELLKVLESPALQIRSKKLLKHSNSDVAMKMIQNLEEIV
jgi:UDP-N-acetylglucosamine--N-acetylmuramyl-(pentapeptide) pyrophosphoryl-undecaprenol N-acetylglucosamine transferase